MKKLIKMACMILGVILMSMCIQNTPTQAEDVEPYTALDSSDPIEFWGSYIVYKGQRITLGPKAIYVDGSLPKAVTDQYLYVYTDITQALSKNALTDGSEMDPMVVYVAPHVYWLDDPDATDVVAKTSGYGVPYGMVVDCDWLKLYGLTTDPYDVVLAGNRGQSNGADGNYTMFRFNGDGLSLQNLTIGNYCSVDLDYPLKPELNHSKRTSTITQAQLADVNGDKVFANNCNFISRLNLDPLGGGKRTLYNKCHFESTDDALNGNAVYLQCDFDFYGNRPFYTTNNTGAVLLNCKFRSVVLNVEAEPYQYFTKEEGTVIAVDSDYTSNFSIPFGIGWTKYPSTTLRCYQYNIKHNGNNISIGGEKAQETVDMTGKAVLDAYRINYNGDVYYNTYNLLRGSDNWDPMKIKEIIQKAGEVDSKDYTSVSTMLSVSSDVSEIESGVSNAVISSKTFRFDGTETMDQVTLSLSEQDSIYSSLSRNSDGTYLLTGKNTQDETKQVVVYGSTPSGLQGVVSVDVKPTIIQAPIFTSNPEIINTGNGALRVNYSLDLFGRADLSQISWYRCTDASGSNPILVSVTRGSNLASQYTLSAGDIGYYIKAVVQPKSIRSNLGEGGISVLKKSITLLDVKAKTFTTNFTNFPNSSQISILPGFWTVDCFKPADTSGYTSWYGDTEVDPWVYGITGNGSVGEGLYQGTQGARLMYTPVLGSYGNMTLSLAVDPAKTAGQGFGSASQYMDICVKFDTTTLTGYGLRIIRTKSASNAVTFVLIKYENGQTTEISDSIIASSFVTNCQITLKVEGAKLIVHVETSTAQLADQSAAGYPHTVDLSADIEKNEFGGVAIFHTGTTGTGGWQNTTMLHQLNINWEGNQGIVDFPEIPQTPGNSTMDDIAPNSLPVIEYGDGDGTAIIQTQVDTGDGHNIEKYAIIWVMSIVSILYMAYIKIIKRNSNHSIK